MRSIKRIAALAGLIALTAALPACSTFDPDKLDIFGWNDKKPIPGDRKNLFPEGVPGVTQGVPPELIKGSPQQQAAAPGNDAAAAATPAEPAAEPEKPKPKVRTVTRKRITGPSQTEPPQARPAPQSQGAWPPGSQPAPVEQAPWPAPGTSSAQ
jgi:hypothetical protein